MTWEVIGILMALDQDFNYCNGLHSWRYKCSQSIRGDDTYPIILFVDMYLKYRADAWAQATMKMSKDLATYQNINISIDWSSHRLTEANLATVLS